MFVHLLMHSCISSRRARWSGYVATEVEEAGAEGQEQQPQEFEVADQVEEPALESNFANPDLQQGKHRFILNPESLH